MRKSGKAIVAAVAMAILMAFSSASAFAGWSWDDCPPGSANEQVHASQTAADHVKGLEGPKNANVHAGGEGGNPGNKFGGK